MDLKSILDYQKKDAELVKLERNLNSSENKKIFSQMIAVVKETQNQSSALEQQAGEMIKSFNSLKRTYEDNVKSASVISNKKLENMSEDEILNMQQLAETISSNLTILEKKLLAQAEKVRTLLTNFEQTKKRYNMARDKYNKHKELFEAEAGKVQPTIDQKSSEIKKLESSIDSKLLAKYKQKRQDKIYPVFVPCVEKTCGGCRMELPSASLSTLKNNGILECEHCRRIIYSQD